jgi:hypothetical protein
LGRTLAICATLHLCKARHRGKKPQSAPDLVRATYEPDAVNLIAVAICAAGSGYGGKTASGKRLAEFPFLA